MKSLYFRIKNPAYGRHQLSRPMRIEAPLPKMYAKQCFEKNRSNFFKLCHHRPILGIRSLTRSLHDTRKWEFWISLINVKKIREKKYPYFWEFCHHRPKLGIFSSTRGLHNLRKWVFRILRISVIMFWKKWPLPLFGKLCHHRPKLGTGSLTRTFLTSGSGCFAMAHTNTQTDRQTDMATLWPSWWKGRCCQSKEVK